MVQSSMPLNLLLFCSGPRKNEHAPLVTPRNPKILVDVPRAQPSRRPRRAQRQRHVHPGEGVEHGESTSVEFDVDFSWVSPTGHALDIHGDEPPRLPLVVTKERQWTVRVEGDDVPYSIFLQVDQLCAFAFVLLLVVKDTDVPKAILHVLW